MRVLVPAALLAAACGAPDAGSGAAERDSAGIRIVESREPSGAAWALAAEPAVVIGTAEEDPNQQLFRVIGEVRLPDGRIAVANAGDHEIRLFSADGHFLRRMGSRGAGPGEFEGMSRLMTQGDSILVYDSRLGRLSRFDAAGNFLGSVSVSLPEGGPPLTLQPLGDGRFAGQSSNTYGMDAEPGTKRDSTTVYVLGPDGEVQHAVGTFPGGERLVIRRGNGMMVTGVAFGRFTIIAAHDGDIYVGDNDRPEVAVFDASGRLRRLVRMAEPPRAVTAGDVAAYRERRLDGLPEAARPNMVELLDAMTFPETFPAYQGLLVDAVGHLWVRAFSTEPEAPTSWRVFGPDGHWVTGLTMPAGFLPYEIGADYVLGRFRDADGIEFVQRYPLARAP